MICILEKTISGFLKTYLISIYLCLGLGIMEEDTKEIKLHQHHLATG